MDNNDDKKVSPDEWFEDLIRKMQTPEFKKGVDQLLHATPQDLAKTFTPVTNQSYGSFDPEEQLDEYIEAMEEIMKLATTILATEDNARRWFDTPSVALNHKSPNDICYSEAGRARVKALLNKIDSGDFT